MHPILLDLGPLTLHTYGLFVALGFLAAIFWTLWEAKRAGLDVNIIPDAAFWIILGALVGARLFFVLIDLPGFLDNPVRIFMFWKGGLVFSGGAIGGTLAGVLYGIIKKQPILKWMDCIAPAVALGQGLGRFGCFFAGCCYGRPTGASWSVVFHDPGCLAPLNTPLHPTQLYHAGAVLLIFGLLCALRRFFHGMLATPGRLTGVFLVLFGLQRVVIEQFRGDFRGFYETITPTQAVALAFFLAGMYLLLRRPRPRS